MAHAILTKYHGATNTKPSRVSAKWGGKTVFVSYDHALSSVQNHEAAALAWLAKHSFAKLSGKLVCGDSPDGTGYVFMLADAVMIHALGNMLQWAIGNRGSKSGNPYSVPEIKDALNVLHEAVTGRHAAVIDGTYDTLDLFKNK